MDDSTWASGTDLTGRKVGERMNENLHPEKHAYPEYFPKIDIEKLIYRINDMFEDEAR